MIKLNKDSYVLVEYLLYCRGCWTYIFITHMTDIPTNGCLIYVVWIVLRNICGSVRDGVRGWWRTVYLHRNVLRNLLSVLCSMFHCSAQGAVAWEHELYPGRHFLFMLDCDEQVESRVAARNSLMSIVLNASWAQSSDSLYSSHTCTLLQGRHRTGPALTGSRI
jgi:hypothetical protein